MPPQLRLFPAEKLQQYPHMFPLDIAIWERFLATHEKLYNTVAYDVKVGTGTPVPANTPPEYARMQDILSKYRIDVVGFDGSQIYIIEVKPEASTVALGQVLTYIELYKRDFAPTLPVKGVIITDRELPDIRYLTQQNNFDYYVI